MVYHTYIMSKLVFRDKKVLDNEHLLEIGIWKVKKDKYTPEGFWSEPLKVDT